MIVNVDDIVAITTAIAKAPSVPADQVEGREYLLLSLFWGDNLWEPYVRDGRLDELRPELANQAGRFYPASGGRAAVIDLLVNGRAGPKQVSEEALATLTRHGVPATLSVEDDGPAIRSWIIVGVVAGLAALVAFGVVARERARRTAGKTRPS